VVSDGDWKSLEVAVSLLPEKKVKEAEDVGERRAPVPSAMADLVVDYPWLADLQAKPRSHHAGAVRCPGVVGGQDIASGSGEQADGDEASPAGDSESSIDEEAPFVDPKEVLAALVLKRNEMALSGAAAELAFSWKVMGGAWTKAHLGLDYDAFRAEARSQHAKEFVALYGLPKSASFTLALYGDDIAKLLAAYWCDKVVHFYGIWSSSKIVGHVFSDVEVQSFRAPKAFTDLLANAAGKISARMRQLQALCPVGPCK
jgi:hypothetical protein